MHKITWIIMAFMAGAILPLQAGFNAKLSSAGGSPVHAATFSFIVGTLVLVLYLLLTRQTVSWSGLSTLPVYAWAGGLLGAFYISTVTLVFPKLGPGLTFGLIVAGQMLFSLVLEHYNVMVMQHQPISLGRIVGLLLIVAGVLMVKKF